MEYRKIQEQISNITSAKGQLIVLKNSVEKYNFFVKLYNNQLNIVNNTSFSYIPCQALYSLGHTIQNKFCYFLLIFLFFPGIILLLRYLITGCQNICFYCMTSYNSCICFFCINSCIFNSISRRIYNKNKKLVSNPFHNMVYYPDLCVKHNVNNEFIEINCEGIS